MVPAIFWLPVATESMWFGDYTCYWLWYSLKKCYHSPQRNSSRINRAQSDLWAASYYKANKPSRRRIKDSTATVASMDGDAQPNVME